MKRFDCDGYFAVLIAVDEVGSVVDGAGSLAAGGALIDGGTISSTGAVGASGDATDGDDRGFDR